MEKPLIEHLHDYAGLMLANLLWLVSSLPLLTLPAATAGLSAVTNAWARTGRRPAVVSVFVAAARRQYLRASLVVLVDAAVAAPLVLNLLIVNSAADPGPLLLAARGVCVAGLLFLAALNVILWPSLERGERMWVAWRKAAMVVVAQPMPVLLTVAATGLVLGVALLLPRFVFLFIAVAAVSSVASRGAAWTERRLQVRLHGSEGLAREGLAHGDTRPVATVEEGIA